MKKRIPHIILIISLIGMLLYMALVSPSLSEPLSLVGFYFLASIISLSGIYIFTQFIASRRRRMAWAVSGTLFILYILALASLTALNVANISLAFIVLVALIFIIERSQL